LAPIFAERLWPKRRGGDVAFLRRPQRPRAWRPASRKWNVYRSISRYPSLAAIEYCHCHAASSRRNEDRVACPYRHHREVRPRPRRPWAATTVGAIACGCFAGGSRQLHNPGNATHAPKCGARPGSFRFRSVDSAQLISKCSVVAMTRSNTRKQNPLEQWKCKSCTDGTCRTCRQNAAWAAKFDSLHGKEMKEYYAPREALGHSK
jgi:hypothetical protein